jgi:phosphatidylserine decarboxylase
MTSIHPDNVTKPVEPIQRDSLPDANSKHAGDALEQLVEQSSAHHDLTHSIHASAHSESILPLISICF